ncbi:MAG: polysaccharide pyruvyl transferase family protein [Butyrivibrio sp.]|nr:polysaccharide pyruvyl transferase family protein [Butyrivibrio sp.]
MSILDYLKNRARAFVASPILFSELAAEDEHRRFILFGTPVHGNMGDHAIILATHKLLEPMGKVVDVPLCSVLVREKKIRKYLRDDDIIIIPGGGWMGDLWAHNELFIRKVLKEYSNTVIIFPQTVFYKDYDSRLLSDLSAYRRERLYICLRDKASYELVLEQKMYGDRDKVFRLPDCALLLDPKIHERRDGVGICFRNDREKSLDDKEKTRVLDWLKVHDLRCDNISTVKRIWVPGYFRKTVVSKTLKEFAKKKLVVTDRLHGMIFAAITGTPCIAFDNNTGKVHGVYEWISDLSYVRIENDYEGFLDAVNSLDLSKDNDYDSEAEKKKFAELVQIIDSCGV